MKKQKQKGIRSYLQSLWGTGAGLFTGSAMRNKRGRVCFQNRDQSCDAAAAPRSTPTARCTPLRGALVSHDSLHAGTVAKGRLHGLGTNVRLKHAEQHHQRTSTTSERLKKKKLKTKSTLAATVARQREYHGAPRESGGKTSSACRDKRPKSAAMTPNVDASEDQVLNYTDAPPTRRNSGMFDPSHERKQKVRARTVFTAEDSHTRASAAVDNRQVDHQKDKNGKTPKTAKTPELNSRKLR